MSEKLQTFAVFASFILSELYNQFPLIAHIDRNRALKTLFPFEEFIGIRTKLQTQETYREILEIILQSDNPEFTTDDQEKLQNVLLKEEGIKKDEELREQIMELEQIRKNLDLVLEGTIAFLEAEGYIRNHDEAWQLTEKGFTHLNKKFTEGAIADANETLISKIKEQFLNPSKLGAQTLLQIISTMASNIS
ncbi:MAG: hypothetical protein KBB35_04340 [Bacteroidales bacterium]|nr:hypothetical protein [Bacteroidales bacterium]